MIRIPCPYCGLRESDEFSSYGVPSSRPAASGTGEAGAEDRERWRRYLYELANRSGWVVERWFHVSGCRRFFAIERHTVTNEVRPA